MELIAVIVMIAGGCAIAIFVVTAIAIAQRENDKTAAPNAAASDRNHLAASILYNILLLGGTSSDEAMRDVRRRAGVVAPVTPGVDIASWGARFGQLAQPQQRAWLLEMAVQLIATRDTPVPLRQYSALLDLSFALGFQTDALARLREQYGFEYIDHAKNARPREADRGGGGMTTFFAREPGGTEELLRVLELGGAPSRQAIISAYRRLAALNHPDRFYDQSEEAQTLAAARFIEITRAYETLLSIYRE
ncbi:MAG TPA: J domain-containing protein [Thermoanaerobaculia bacterium]|nr:J domain-containing protein [Thermoanaerobaculia bacterium]